MTDSVIFDELPVGIARISLEGRLLATNKRFNELVKYSETELAEMTFQDIVHPDDYWGDRENRSSLIQRGGGSYHDEKRYIRSDGQETWVDLTVSLVADESGAPSEFLAMVNDIDLMKHREVVLADPAFLDPLTGLPNRSYFERALNDALIAGRKTKQKIGLLFVSLNNFDNINDAEGKWIGHDVLKAVGSRLAVLGTRTSLIARLRGNEFVYMIQDMPTERAVLGKMNKLNQLLDVPVHVAGQSVAVSTCIGYAVYPDHARTAEGLIRLADLSMYSNKQGSESGGGSYKRHGLRPTRTKGGGGGIAQTG